ncbi:tetratricopeptide repeat protein [uncultured Acetatifactor sp.]|uniref:tetratricopeptide repeat protein n=1 Tax=uncultured Acetatifactor sp. TaxID=1671927 RepID=UPI00272D80D5|nr:hypothetical protein [uncultured Acetatifactor sp.]
MDKTIRMSGSCEGTVHLKRMSRDEDYIRDACRQTEAYSKEALRARLGEGILFTGTWAGATDCQELDEEELLEGELSASGETALDSQAALLVLARPAGSLAMVQIHARQQRGRMQHGRLWTQRCSSQGAMKGEQMDRKRSKMNQELNQESVPCWQEDAMESGEEKNIVDMMQYEKAAEENSPKAQYEMGICYLEGRDVEEDDEKAIECFRKAAEMGYEPAQGELGWRYYLGSCGLRQDFNEALKWYKMAGRDISRWAGDWTHGFLYNYLMATEQNDPDAQLQLGDAYLKGVFSIHLDVDRKEAVKWYRLAAGQGNTMAQFSLRRCEEFDEWHQRAAEQGDIEAQVQVANCFMHGIGVRKDEEQARRWYRKPAELGNPEAQAGLGQCYFDDYYMDRCPNRADCGAEAANWSRKALEQGYIPALRVLADCYWCGAGVEEDQEKAIRLTIEAAEQGYAPAQFDLGEHYRYEDDEEAVKWYRMAAEQGYGEAQAELGQCYEFGEGVEEDKVKAAMWRQKAAEQRCISLRTESGYT